MKLEIELIPSTCWYKNLREKIKKSEWDKIRKKAYSEAGNRCEICGKRGRLNCHELWGYNDRKHIQKLKGFIALCNKCHWVKHLGLAEIRAAEGKFDYETLVRHFMKVNSTNRAQFEKHRRDSFRKWEERSSHDWEMDFGDYETLIYPASEKKI